MLVQIIKNPLDIQKTKNPTTLSDDGVAMNEKATTPSLLTTKLSGIDETRTHNQFVKSELLYH